MQVSATQATSLLTAYIKANLVPMLVGSPGIGKSAIIHSIAKEYNLKVIDLRLSQCDPTDLMGFPHFENGRAGYAPMNTFPIEGDALPKGKDGWLLFLDEFNSASTAVQASAYKLVLDRMVGQFSIHPKVAIMCAGNLDTDNAITQEMSTALQSRLVHLELQINPTEWCSWAMSNGISHKITDYIKFKPSALYTFKPDHSDKTYACPRTWEFANRLMDYADTDDMLPLLAGTLSEGVAREFITFTKIYESLPKMESIIKDPTGTAVPDEPSVLFAITGSLANHVTEKNCSTIMKYADRLPKEFQVLFLREAIKRNPTLITHASVLKWAENTGTALM